MIYSRTCGYAIQAATRLALLRPEGYILLEELCAGTDLPRAFVAKILRKLVREGLLRSAKGRCGGFALARRPDMIRVYDIVMAIDGVLEMQQCVVSKTICNEAQPCPLHDQWRVIWQQVQTYLMQTTLADTSKTLGQKLSLPINITVGQTHLTRRTVQTAS